MGPPFLVWAGAVHDGLAQLPKNKRDPRLRGNDEVLGSVGDHGSPAREFRIAAIRPARRGSKKWAARHEAGPPEVGEKRFAPGVRQAAGSGARPARPSSHLREGPALIAVKMARGTSFQGPAAVLVWMDKPRFRPTPHLRERRRRRCMRFALTDSSGAEIAVIVRDISTHGLSAAALGASPALNEVVRARLQDGRELWGLVRWREDNLFGVEFDTQG